MDHDGLVVLRDRVKCLLHDVASEWIHREIERVATDSFGDLDDLLWSAMLEAALDQEISKAIDHERVCLSNNGFDNFVFLLRSSDFELLLEEDGSLLVVVADNLVDDVLPIAIDVAIQKTTIVEGLGGGQIRLSFSSDCLESIKLVMTSRGKWSLMGKDLGMWP